MDPQIRRQVEEGAGLTQRGSRCWRLRRGRSITTEAGAAAEARRCPGGAHVALTLPNARGPDADPAAVESKKARQRRIHRQRRKRGRRRPWWSTGRGREAARERERQSRGRAVGWEFF